MVKRHKQGGKNGEAKDASERESIWFLTWIWAIDANQLIFKIPVRSFYRFVNPVRQAFKANILCAGDDSKVPGMLAMQSKKVFSIER
ncbi:MAG: hypothetical protein EPGJADBJ_03882 [Saprospiraceae bacterium]|nr:hypothetical protein [Saprospiraceae bacterium]